MKLESDGAILEIRQEALMSKLPPIDRVVMRKFLDAVAAASGPNHLALQVAALEILDHYATRMATLEVVNNRLASQAERQEELLRHLDELTLRLSGADSETRALQERVIKIVRGDIPQS